MASLQSNGRCLFLCHVVRIRGGIQRKGRTNSNGHTRKPIPAIPFIPVFYTSITYTNNTNDTSILHILLDTIHTTNTSKKHIQIEKIHYKQHDICDILP
jgi:hypothetical protein